MKNELLTLSSEKSEKDIDKYLFLPIKHLNMIICNLELLSRNECEKIHVADVLKECIYYKKELLDFKSSYYNSTDSIEKIDIFNKIVNSVQNLFNIEEDLIEDYPTFFTNDDYNWVQYISENQYVEPDKVNDTNQVKKSLKFRKLIFGFLFPAFVLLVLYPWLTKKINTDTEPQFINITKINYDYERSYKNFFYIYSSVILNKNSDSNFYNLIKSNSFKIPEGFVIIDKNLIIDYYLKEYFGIKKLESESNITTIYINNMNYVHCKYVLTKFSAIASESASLNDKPLIFTPDFKSEDVCISDTDTNKMNNFSLNVKKQDF